MARGWGDYPDRRTWHGARLHAVLPARDEKPDVVFIFVPAGDHAVAAVRTYSALGMAAAGTKLIGPGDIVQDTKLLAGDGVDGAGNGFVSAAGDVSGDADGSSILVR